MTTKTAPKGKFRVIGVDTFDHTDYLIGDYKTREEAVDTAAARGGTMNKTYVYNDLGDEVSGGFGTY